MLGLAKLLASLRYDVTFPGDRGATIHKRVRPPCPIEEPGTLDPIWIPQTAARGWLVITRDSRIRQHRAELASVTDHGARLVALAGSDARTTWDQLEIVMCQWRSIEGLTDLPGPFVYTATRTTLTKIE